MSYEQERAKLNNITPKTLPKNTAESGLGADLIQEKFYAGIFYLHELLEEARQKFAQDDAALQADINALDADLTSLTGRVATLEANPSYYVALAAQVEALQLMVNSHAASISSIQSAITTITANITTLRSDIVNGTISAYKAVRDGDGNVIKTTYATIAALTLTNSEVAKIKSGDTVVGKAAKDDEGSIIKSTYVKKSQVVDNVTSTSTDAPLSANQGKYLKGLIDAITALLASNDTDLDTIQEIVTYVKNNKSLIDNITTGKVSVSDIVDNLTSEIANKPVSAKQAYILKCLIDTINTTIGNNSSGLIKRIGDLETAMSNHSDIINGFSVVDGAVNITYTE